MERLTLFGCGRLGICTALVFEKNGYDVLGVEVNKEFADKINQRTLSSYEPGVVDTLKTAKNLRVTLDANEGINWSDMIFICVDTPSTDDEHAYNTFKLDSVLKQINAAKAQNKHIMVMCTVMPGYCDRAKKEFLGDTVNCTLNYNPEFIAQGQILQGFQYPDVVLIGGETQESGERIAAVYRKIVKKEDAYFAIMSPVSAELEKISLNCFITTKIAYANMIADIADRIPGCDKFAILKAVGADSRVNPKALLPGYSFSGPCFPRDNRALARFARSVGADARISLATEECNNEHVVFQAHQIMKKGKETYVFEHIAYKHPCDVPICEESAKCRVAWKIAQAGHKVILRDFPPFLADAKRWYGEHPNITFQDISEPCDLEIDG